MLRNVECNPHHYQTPKSPCKSPSKAVKLFRKSCYLRKIDSFPAWWVVHCRQSNSWNRNPFCLRNAFATSCFDNEVARSVIPRSLAHLRAPLCPEGLHMERPTLHDYTQKLLRYIQYIKSQCTTIYYITVYIIVQCFLNFFSFSKNKKLWYQSLLFFTYNNHFKLLLNY